MFRRHFLQALPLAAAAVSTVPKGAFSQAVGGGSKTLVAYFSRTGNTRVIAYQIRRAKDAALFEIDPAVAYPEDYEETVAQARRETASGYLPPLRASVRQVRQYDAVYLGFPIWGMTAPPVIRSFIRTHDLSEKAVYPFITHGGYGLGNSIDVVTSLAPRAHLKPVLSMEADQERQTLEQVRGWLDG
ncbi:MULTISPECIES: flavodoxin [Rhizobium]|uniref:Twin-arginine translocation pathway signal n=1 Tax=Rhizobium favelukesii TaxID=348824 RepID=W6RIZ6_9HYPH|nr:MULTISPECIES: flavodoxin [Rhizobium]MCS0461539.1 flavodoxin [Rhizobium favelukesii]UFS85541.1 flavodoxin [Rhizobium sp. T136]CDM60839.1 twin-arginine translocation pathway signal [Rhizobium favelukesii]